jgi:hypothetical protein
VKLLCLIFSFYVLLLSAKPCCSDNDCQGEISGKKELAGKTSSRHTECPGCSPFFTCGSCVGFILTKPLTITLPLISESYFKLYYVYQQPHLEKVALSIWLPPKIS